MVRIWQTAMLVWIAVWTLPSAAEREPGGQAAMLPDGAEREWAFAVDPGRPLLLWVRGRIALPEGEAPGAHALELTLNGVRLTPENVRVLNKREVYDLPGGLADASGGGRPAIAPPDPDPVPLFSEASGGWYLKADADYYPFNAQGAPTDPYTSMGGAVPARVRQPNLSANLLQNLALAVSHYYEYLFEIPPSLVARANTLKAVARVPERLVGRPVEVACGPIFADAGVVTYHRPTVTEFTHVSQAPSLPDVVHETAGLRLTACAGEFEATSVTLFATRPLADVTIEIEPLVPERHAGAPVPAAAAQVYYLAQRLPHQQSAARFPFTRAFAPQAGTATAADADPEARVDPLGETAAERTGGDARQVPAAVAAGPDGVAPDLLIRQGEKPVAAGHPVSIPYVYAVDRRDPEKTAAANARSRELERIPGIPVAAMTSQRFVVDLRVPPGQAPGAYRGTVVVREDRQILRRIPLTLEVYPFDLPPPRQKYWMWRQTWLPVTEPGSVAAIRMIADAGMHGICRLAGMGLDLRVDRATGAVAFDASIVREGRRILEDAGLSLSYAHDLVSPVFHHVCRSLCDIRPGSIEWFGYQFQPELADSPLNPSRYKAAPRDPTPEQLAELRRRLPEIRAEMVKLLKRMRAVYDEAGVDPRHFAYDEPDGTAWAHPWVKFSNGVAREAGFQTWSSHNDPLAWDSGIDLSVMASVAHYRPNRIHRERFGGRMAHRDVPEFGGFAGRLDEVVVYRRALTDEEMLRQHAAPAEVGRLAWYPFDAEGTGAGRNALGDATLDLAITAAAGVERVEGVRGRALRLTDRAVRLRPAATAGAPTPLPGAGWAISFWYSGRGTVLALPEQTLRFVTGDRGPQVTFRAKSEEDGDGAGEAVTLPDDRGIRHDDTFWNHVTISVDEGAGEIAYYLHNEEQRDYYRRNVTWNYSQYRSFNPMLCRVQAGYSTWHMRELDHMTVFVFDLNFGIANLAWPEGGERMFNRPETRWYPGLGLLALREGVDDARYAHALYQALVARVGAQAAWDRVADLFPGREVVWQEIYDEPTRRGLSFDGVRALLAAEILKAKAP